MTHSVLYIGLIHHDNYKYTICYITQCVLHGYCDTLYILIHCDTMYHDQYHRIAQRSDHGQSAKANSYCP